MGNQEQLEMFDFANNSVDNDSYEENTAIKQIQKLNLKCYSAGISGIEDKA